MAETEGDTAAATSNRSVEPADFSVLDGVGSKTAAGLRAAGYTTMKELAMSRVDDVVGRLADADSPVPSSRIVSQRWLFQAWNYIDDGEAGVDWLKEKAGWSDQPRASSPPGGAAETAGAAPGIDLQQDASSVTPNPTEDDQSAEWVEHATYIVIFDHRYSTDGEQWQTRVWDGDAMVEEVFANTDPNLWSTAIMVRAGLTD